MTNDLECTEQEPHADETMVPVFSSSNHDAEMEAEAVRGLLESSRIPAILVGSHVLPNLEFQVQVPEHLLDQARLIIRGARQNGRRAAEEAEAATEE
jgi:hypothetical protein